MSIATLILILQLKLQILQLQLALLQASTTPETAQTAPLAPIIQAPTPFCPAYDAYGTPVFCSNQPLPTFCPASSTIRNWNKDIPNQYFEMVSSPHFIADQYANFPKDFNYDKEIWCGMIPSKYMFLK